MSDDHAHCYHWDSSVNADQCCICDGYEPQSVREALHAITRISEAMGLYDEER